MDFYKIGQFPCVIAVDGTHIRIHAPTEDEYTFVNRKNYHSFNVQGTKVNKLFVFFIFNKEVVRKKKKKSRQIEIKTVLILYNSYFIMELILENKIILDTVL